MFGPPNSEVPLRLRWGARSAVYGLKNIELARICSDSIVLLYAHNSSRDHLYYCLITSSVVSRDVTQISTREGNNVEFKCDHNILISASPRMEWKFTSGSNTVLIYYENEKTAPYKDRVQVYTQGMRLDKVTRQDSGEYVCEVTGKGSLYDEIKSLLVVLVPPSVPVAGVPSSVSTGSVVTLSCIETVGSPPPTFTWYKNGILLPSNPKSNPTFQNTSYTLDSSTGLLQFDQVMKTDSGEYNCEAMNTEGKQVSAAVRMQVDDVNVGGIVAAVIVSLLIIVLIAFGIWFAYRRGYIGKKSNKKVIYSQPSETRSDKNFQQTSSFVV